MIDLCALTNINGRVVCLLFCRPNRSRLPTYSAFFFALLIHSTEIDSSKLEAAHEAFFIILIYYLLLARKNVTSTLDCHFFGVNFFELKIIYYYFFLLHIFSMVM